MQWFVVGLIALAISSLQTASAKNAAAVTLQPCKLADVSRTARCATMTVPENRAKPGGRSIALNIAVLEAPGERKLEPVVFFAGGPGQGAVAIAASIARDLAKAASGRDIILIDQRGTGGSNLLTCDGGFTVLSPARVDDLRACRAALAGRADLTRYTTDESVADVADVLRALGHTRVNVIAASYGTRLALHFMQRHPSFVRTAVLRAVAPHDYNVMYDGGRQAHAALERVLTDCADDVTCRSAFPDLRRDLETIRASLRTPQQIGELQLTSDLFERTLYALLLSTQTRQMIPLLIHTAATKGAHVLAGPATSIEAVYNTVAVGAYLSVLCGEDVPRLSATQKRELAKGFAAVTEAVINACVIWQPAATATTAKIVPSDVPTLVISGELDPAMPAAIGERALGQLRRGTHLVVPATAHGPTLPGCVADLVYRFIETASAATLNPACLSSFTLPPFRLTP